jgi:endoglucanase
MRTHSLIECSAGMAMLLAIAGCGENIYGHRTAASTNDPFSIATALTLDHSSLAPGATQAGHVTYRNTTSGNLQVNKIVIAMRPPGGSHAGGPYDDASPEPGPLTVAAGATVSVDATRTFAASGGQGTWEAYATYQDAGGTWHDGPSVFFSIADGSDCDHDPPDLGAPPGDMATTPPTDAGAPTSAGFFHTSGGDIVDATGKVVRLTGLSWFGFETNTYALHGLWQARSIASYLDQIKSLGYNVIRIPYSNQLFDAGSTPNGINWTANSELMGLDGLHILDRLVAEAGKRDLRLILDRHRPDSNLQSELWYTAQYSEARWISDWVMLATRYKGNSTVIGADLHNEPHGTATWGDGNMSTDWRLAAERAGNAILAVNSDWLIIVEGVEKVGSTSYWWGGNLSAAGQSPVRLNVPNRLVYSPHDYPASLYAQSWFSAPNYPANLAGVWDQYWGFLAKQKVAPIWIGEFGTKNQTTSDQQWLTSMVSYIRGANLSFSYWCWNPDSGDTGGILQDDWQTVNNDKQAVLQPALAPAL